MLKFSLSVLLLGLYICCFAQVSKNVNLKGNWDDNSLAVQSGLSFNDIWGYTDEAFKEYGIIGSLDFTHFIDINDPENPTEIARIAAPSRSLWRDFKTYLHYGYGVSDNSGGKLQIFDLSGLPNQVNKVFDSNTFFSSCHNIFIDEKNGRLYAVGTSRANIVVLDIMNDPANPTLLANINLTDGYIHDMYVRDHIAYASHIYKSKLTVYDLSDLNNLEILGSISGYVDAGLNHSNWLSEDGTIMAMADENHGLAVKIVNTTDLSDMTVMGTLKSTLEAANATNSIAHNPFIIGNNYVVISYYHDGIQIYDISDPANPVKAGYYDTQPNNTNYNGYKGSWGVYPFFPSKNIIASDINNGLFVIRPTFDMDYCRDNLYSAKVVVDGETIQTNSREAIYLRHGFHAKAGSVFRGHIEECTAPFVDKADKEKAVNRVETNNPLLINEALTTGVEVYPNPFTKEFSILVKASSISISSIQLINNLGQEMSIDINNCGEQCFRIASDNLTSGIYTVMIKQGREVLKMKRLVKL